MSRALIYFQHNPHPASTGAHQRCLAVLRALKELGWDVTLMGSNLLTDTHWSPSMVRDLERLAGIKVEVYHGTSADMAYSRKINWLNLPQKIWGDFAPPGLRRAFRRQVEACAPDAVIVNYTYFGNLVRELASRQVLTIMETLDLFSLNARMQNVVSRYIPQPPIAPDSAPDDLLDEDFFAAARFDAFPEEYAVCDQYDWSVAVSATEQAALSARTGRTKIALIPITAEPRAIANQYDGIPMTIASLNMVNVQGMLYFARRVLPRLRQTCPGFRMDLLGACQRYLDKIPDINPVGYVDDLAPRYAATPFTICPLIAATGQQIKVVESMAYGVPVVILANTAHSAPIVHGVNGLIARDAQEFAACCEELYRNRPLCRKLGEHARETIRTEYSHERLCKGFEAILQGRQVVRPLVSESVRQPARAIPEVSVIVDTGQDSGPSDQAVASVIAQREVDVEILVVRGEAGSRRPFANVSVRPAPTLRAALRAAKGAWITVLTPEDVLEPGALDAVLQAGCRHPRISWLAGRPALRDAQGDLAWIGAQPSALLRHPAFPGIPGLPPAHGVFFRRACLPALAPALKKDAVGDVCAWWWRLLAPQTFGYIDALLCSRRTALAPATAALHGEASALAGPDGASPAAIREQPILLPSANERLHQALRHLDRQRRFIFKPEDDLLDPKGKRKKFCDTAFVRMVYNRWLAFGSQEGRRARVCLFGAGTHTHWMAPILRDPKGPEVAAILDDFPAPGKRIGGIPICQAAGFDMNEIDAIIPSTDASERRFIERCRELYGPKIPIWLIYEGMPPGPYEKPDLARCLKRHTRGKP